eukprot:CAMPEP_0184491498 /NCGR_PEP_ID=MMETSP0113_2-20130426/20551_1 /TAXON_ID=91329 /ORGANISM="Norrisiella sphaerica, Strain BC52" /LENGTH=323 /DNA_ID=CAMNT_0026875891 /DNA_START=93 /DNA_END=1061 /DNA_ORIENTATION=+
MESVVDAIHILLDERDEKEKNCFEGAFSHCEKLMGLQKQLRNRNFELERRLVDMQSQTETADPMTAAHMQSLELKLKQKDEELSKLYRQQATNAQKMLTLSEKAQEDAKELEKKEMEIQALKNASSASEDKVDEAKRDRSKFEGENTILKSEMESLRKNLDDAHEKIKLLAKENAVLVERILSMKNQQVDQMNQMNEVYEKAYRLSQESQQTAKNDQKYGGLPEKTVILEKMAWQRNFNVQMPVCNSRAVHAHKGQACALAFDRSGKTIVTCGTDSVVQLYDTKSGNRLDSLSGLTASILDIEFSPDEKLIIAAGNDSRAVVW